MSIFKIPFYRLLPLSVLLLAACSSLKELPLVFVSKNSKNQIASDQWPKYQAQLKKIQQFQIRGSVAYFSDKKKIYARFFWQQYSPENYHLLLLNPLGQIEFEVKVEHGRVYVANNQDQQELQDDPEKILFKLTGIPIPLNHLTRWILGIPSDSEQIVLNPHCQLKSLIYQYKEQTWKVDYPEYKTNIVPILPERLELNLSSPESEDHRIKLKIDDWILT